MSYISAHLHWPPPRAGGSYVQSQYDIEKTRLFKTSPLRNLALAWQRLEGRRVTPGGGAKALKRPGHNRRIPDRMVLSGQGKRCQEGVKKLTISRKDAKAQRFICRNFFVFFAPIAALRLCVNYFCSSWNYFTPSEPLHFRAAMQREGTRNSPRRRGRAAHHAIRLRLFHGDVRWPAPRAVWWLARLWSRWIISDGARLARSETLRSGTSGITMKRSQRHESQSCARSAPARRRASGLTNIAGRVSIGGLCCWRESLRKKALEFA